jgi:hypothetical protein
VIGGAIDGGAPGSTVLLVGDALDEKLCAVLEEELGALERVSSDSEDRYRKARTFITIGGRDADACPSRSDVDTRDAVVTRILAAARGPAAVY